MNLTPRQLTQLHRRQQLALREATVAEVERLWPALDWADLDGSFPRLAGAVAAVVARRRRTAAGLSAAYLRTFRAASGLGGDVQVVIPPPLVLEQFQASLHATSVAPAKAAAAVGVVAEVAMTNVRTRSSGAMARLVLDAGRETVIETVKSDPKGRGWRRVLGAGGCDFCRERAGIRITSDVVFEAHDKCGCTAEPSYG